MLFVQEIHDVVAGRMEEFGAALRDAWRPHLEAEGTARLLWGWELTHGTGPSYQAITLAAVRDWAAWGDLVERRRRHAPWREVDAHLWTLRREHADEIVDMVVAPDGDVVAVGSWRNPGARLLAVRLRGRDGRRRWRTEIASPAVTASNQRANAVAIAPSGDVVVAGSLDAVEGPVPRDETFVVLALDGQRGSERWRYQLQLLPPPTVNAASAVVVDADGDVYAGGAVTVGRYTSSEMVAYAVVKLDGATGAERWRTVLDPTFAGESFALTPEGDVAVGGDIRAIGVNNEMAVTLVDGATGAVRWSRPVATGHRGSYARAFAVIGLAGGDVVAAGLLRDPTGLARFSVVRLGVADGAERWRQQLSGDDGEGGGGLARALALTPDGHIVVGGETSRPGTCQDMTIAELAAEDGAVRRVRHIDGTARATSCVPPDCERPPCGDPRAGIDNDSFGDLAVLPSGQIVVSGEVCDGRRGRTRGWWGACRSTDALSTSACAVDPRVPPAAACPTDPCAESAGASA